MYVEKTNFFSSWRKNPSTESQNQYNSNLTQSSCFLIGNPSSRGDNCEILKIQ